jgi:hypothetical protein
MSLSQTFVVRRFRGSLTPRAFAPFAALAAFITLAIAAPAAHADDEFQVTVSKGQVVVTAKGDWHINKDFPWKLVVGDAKLDKTKFTLTEKDATVTNAPAGTGKIKGAVCSHDSCHTLEKEVSIP